MAERYSENPNYKGPPKEYVPEIGERTPALSVNGQRTNYKGYHDLELLRRLLAQIIIEAENNISGTTAALEPYNLQILSTSLQDVQKAEWPSELGDPKDYISYHQYAAYENVDSRGAKYARKAYEDTVRGPAGTCALDIQHISIEIRNEARRIEDFLDEYLGSVDDASEYRILEAFQDWAQMALKYARIFWHIFESRNEDEGRIPDKELSQLSRDQATNWQTLFKTKLNGFNDKLTSTLEGVKKDYAFQDQFYGQFLGPSLKFRLDVNPSLNDTMTQGFFANQAASAEKVFSDHIRSALADQVKRNGMFEQKFHELESLVKARNAYTGYIKQLSTVGSSVKNPFVQVDISGEEKAALQEYGEAAKTAAQNNNTFSSGHSDLSGRDDPEAHSQYILKTGDTLAGALAFADGATIDGIRPSQHTHNGEDGSTKIPGSSLVVGSLETASVQRAEGVGVPVELRVMSQKQEPGSDTIALKLAWDIDDEFANHQFELQLIRFDPGEARGCLVGHLLEYPEEDCDPSANPRYYLNRGLTQSDILPIDVDPGFVTKHCSVVPVNDRVFIILVAAPNETYPLGTGYENFDALLCARSGDDLLAYTVLDKVHLGASLAYVFSLFGIDSGYQGYLSGCKVSDTQIIASGTDVAIVSGYSYGGLSSFLVDFEVSADGTSGSFTDTAKVSYNAYPEHLIPIPPGYAVNDFGGQRETQMLGTDKFIVNYNCELNTPEGYEGISAASILWIGRLKDHDSDGTYGSLALGGHLTHVVYAGYDMRVAQVLVMSPTRLVVLYGRNSTRLGASHGSTYSSFVRVIDISDTGTAIRWYSENISQPENLLPRDEEVIKRDPVLLRINASQFLVVWAEEGTGTCEPDSTTLRAQRYGITVDTASNWDINNQGGTHSVYGIGIAADGDEHVIDGSLRESVEFPLIVDTWSANEAIVVWGSPADDPTVDVSVRSKTAILDVNSSDLTQEVWDIPIEIPYQDSWGALSGGRLGDTDRFVIAAASTDDGLAPVAFTPDDELRYELEDNGIAAYIVDKCSEDAMEYDPPV